MGIVLEQELRQWVENGVSENAIMLHGSGIEALFELIYTGKLPVGIDQITSKRDPTIDRVYFTPIFTELEGTGLYSEIRSNFHPHSIDELTHEFAIRMSRYSAEEKAKTFYLCSKFGILNPEIYVQTIDICEGDFNDDEFNKATFDDFINLLSSFGISTNVNQLRDYNKESQQRSGIFIEPTKEILELPYIVPFSDSVGIFCPGGLDKRYIKGVKLLGQVEEHAVQDYLAGNETGIGRFTVL